MSLNHSRSLKSLKIILSDTVEWGACKYVVTMSASRTVSEMVSVTLESE